MGAFAALRLEYQRSIGDLYNDTNKFSVVTATMILTEPVQVFVR